MDAKKCLVLAATCLLASACESTPKSYMLVPSRTTVPELEKLSRQSGTTVDVLTVNREERRFLLDAGDGAVLTGHDLDVAPRSPLTRLLSEGAAAVPRCAGSSRGSRPATVSRWCIFGSVPLNRRRGASLLGCARAATMCRGLTSLVGSQEGGETFSAS